MLRVYRGRLIVAEFFFAGGHAMMEPLDCILIFRDFGHWQIHLEKLIRGPANWLHHQIRAPVKYIKATPICDRLAEGVYDIQSRLIGWPLFRNNLYISRETNVSMSIWQVCLSSVLI